MPAPIDPQTPHEPALPPLLRGALNRLDKATPLPSLDALDQSVLAAADTHFARRARNHARIRTIRIAAGIAASIALIAAVAWRMAPARHAGQTLAADTLDTSHPVTILDAFHLARLLEGREGTHAALSPTWDVTRDGVIDKRDVDALAQRAVKLSAATPAKSETGGGT